MVLNRKASIVLFTMIIWQISQFGVFAIDAYFLFPSDTSKQDSFGIINVDAQQKGKLSLHYEKGINNFLNENAMGVMWNFPNYISLGVRVSANKKKENLYLPIVVDFRYGNFIGESYWFPYFGLRTGIRPNIAAKEAMGLVAEGGIGMLLELFNHLGFYAELGPHYILYKDWAKIPYRFRAVAGIRIKF